MVISGVPVVGRRDDHGIDVAVIEQAAEVAVPLDRPARSGRRPRRAGRGGPRRRRRVDVGLVLEVEHVPLADQPEADEADADTVVRPQRPANTRRPKAPTPPQPAQMCGGSSDSGCTALAVAALDFN